MLGLITSRDVIRHAPLIVAEFGWATLGRCMWALVVGKRCTFLEML